MSSNLRDFLATALASAPLFVPRRAWGANARLAYGLVGAGGQRFNDFHLDALLLRGYK